MKNREPDAWTADLLRISPTAAVGIMADEGTGDAVSADAAYEAEEGGGEGSGEEGGESMNEGGTEEGSGSSENTPSETGTESGGDIKILKDLDTSVQDLDILLVEDIVDTGRTLDAVISLLKNKGARSVKIVTLLDKPSRRVLEMKPDYVGFEVPNEFVVGFGMDYNQLYRGLPYIGVLKEECYQ